MQKTMGFCQTMVHRETENSVCLLSFHNNIKIISKLDNYIFLSFHYLIALFTLNFDISEMVMGARTFSLQSRLKICKILLHSIVHLILFIGNEFLYWYISLICHKSLHYKPRIKFEMDRDQCAEETNITQQKRCQVTMEINVTKGQIW